MGRNTVTKRQQQAPQAPAQADAPPMRGGTPGVPGVATRLTAVPRQDGRPTGGGRARQYMVTGGPMQNGRVSVMYNSCKTAMDVGKVVSEASVDVEHLRKQGVRLQEILPDPEPEPTEPAEVAPEGEEGGETEGEEDAG
jgi:hypothetical protein